MDFDYTMARPVGSDGDFERVIDTDYPVNEDGSPSGEDDMFRLEFSGWKRHVEFQKVAK